MPWKPGQTKDILVKKPFTVQEIPLIENDTDQLIDNFYRIKSADFVNILPITTDGQVILIKQQRIGTCSYTLEAPGGMVDPGEDKLVAAKRELEEETGYISSKFKQIVSISPNPALVTNHLHIFLATDCYINPDRKHFPDDTEELELVITPYQELIPKVLNQEINHALSALTIYMGLEEWDRIKSL